jgi:hypothetical protein
LHHVFISYASNDGSIAEVACSAIEAAGLRCWMAPRDVPAGTSYAEALMSALNSSHAMVLIFSETASQSPHVLREVERAVSRKCPLLVVRIADALPHGAMEYLISASHWMDALGGLSERQCQRLADAVRALLSMQGDQHGALPASLLLTLACRATTDIGKMAMALSRSSFDSKAGKRGLEFESRRVRDDATETTILEVSNGGEPVYLYDERVSEAPTDETYRASLLQILRQAERQRLHELCVFPTGRARGFSRLRALQATLRAYDDYLAAASVVTLPSVTSLQFALDQDDPYEHAALVNGMRKHMSGNGLIATRYVAEACGEQQAPLARFKFVLRPETPA